MDLPFIVKPFNIFLLFLAEVAVLHIIFIAIPPFRLRKTSLAVVQYIVLLLAVLGLVSAISNARQQVAQNLFNFSKPNVEFEFRSLRSRIDDYSAPGLACMTFVRSPASPPAAEFDRTQHDYDEACQWFKQIASSVPRDLPPDNADISLNSLPPQPHFSGHEADGFVQRFKESLDEYNRAAEHRRFLEQASRRSDAEEFFVILLPLSVSLALALQFTKVTADTWFKPS
jgi:hypothetical protein